MPKSSCACALTSKEARGGERRKDGECVMTKLAYKEAGYEHAPPPSFTICNGCHKRVCIDCWECMADKLDDIVRDRSIVTHDVWHAFSSRAWRAFDDDICCSVRGFQRRRPGGGIWLKECPLCVEQTFEPPSPPMPRTISGNDYLLAPSRFRRMRFTVHSRMVMDDACLSDVKLHTVELYIYQQLVDNDEARRCFW